MRLQEIARDLAIAGHDDDASVLAETASWLINPDHADCERAAALVAALPIPDRGRSVRSLAAFAEERATWSWRSADRAPSTTQPLS